MEQTLVTAEKPGARFFFSPSQLCITNRILDITDTTLFQEHGMKKLDWQHRLK